MRKAFPKNLRLLCSYHESISDVARRLGMNRQQIMKYLSGTAYPSARSMRRLCDFFGVEEHEIVMPDDQFRDIVRLKPALPVSADLTPPVLSALLKAAAGQTPQLRVYTGYYYEFRYSFTSPHLVLKSLLHIHESDGLVMYKSIERLRDHETDSAPAGVDVFKYAGVLMMIGNRIHMLDQEAVMGQELSHMVLFPPYRSRISALRGMKMGVTATAAHEPIAGRVVLEKIGRTVALRRAMRHCGLYAPASDGVPGSVLEYLGRPGNGEPVTFNAEADPPADPSTTAQR
ncbi:helix-turn-helix transcriptional regulator [Tranquillimonas alkanivorans]|uniref:Helix-turn-helix domain-containing protein n=1 Tax=Tranquillimonas alkanivorans TaxID=441119 RepID=A0A1I5UPD2_9RHOB|nr:helix-turn-helix transcriptional regulator [Tranquillimonas alkanivorans]SFP96937.1 Helix-turn-helix domain-containing protein [Tranquillimonas alkanivorans]